jgi:hypothetical protein
MLFELFQPSPAAESFWADGANFDFSFGQDS